MMKQIRCLLDIAIKSGRPINSRPDKEGWRDKSTVLTDDRVLCPVM